MRRKAFLDCSLHEVFRFGYKLMFVFLVGVILLSCYSIYPESQWINLNGDTIKNRFKVPSGYQRIAASENSFAEYLQNLKLKKHGSKVYLYNKELKYPETVYDAVIDMDVGEKDLQQCADAVMRLRAEYLYNQEKYEEIHFNFTNGFNADYNMYAQGYRFHFSRNSVSWKKKAKIDYSYKTFRNYLEIVYNYAGSASLSKELKLVKDTLNIKIGDVFIQGGFPGHAVIVVDMAKSKTSGEKIFLIAQSYMPAQDIQVLKNPNNDKLSPWYSNQNLDTLITPEWTFEKNTLKRFQR